MKFKSIRQITQAHYSVDVDWGYLKKWLTDLEDTKVILQPDFQRAHVWTLDQQIAYIEWIMRGGRSGKDIQWNCPGWQYGGGGIGPMILVDGLQRVTAVQKFMGDEIPAYGHLQYEFDHIPILGCSFKFHIMDLEKKSDILQWYLDMNSGGTDHTREELNKVRELLANEQGVSDD